MQRVGILQVFMLAFSIAVLTACASNEGRTWPSETTPSLAAKREAAFIASQLRTRFGGGSTTEEVIQFIEQKNGKCNLRVRERLSCELPVRTYECVVTYVAADATVDDSQGLIRELTTAVKQKAC
jgi:hypothetical protein